MGPPDVLRYVIAFFSIQIFAYVIAEPVAGGWIARREHSTKPFPIRLMTFNIRYAASPSGNEKAWSERRVNLINQIAFEISSAENSLIGLQEALKTQLDDIISGLNDNPSTSGQGWAYLGVGRDDGKEKGEHSPILYRKSVWEILEFDTKWLSETPDVPSFGWGASNRRIVTIAVLRHRATGNVLLALNTHLDHQISKARKHGAELILDLINKYKTNGSAYKCDITGVTLTGDLNSEENQEAYTTFTNSNVVADSRKSLPDNYSYGNENTFTGFDSDTGTTKLDHIFLGPGSTCGNSKPKEWKVKSYGVLPNIFDDGIIFSDHRAVVSDVELA